MGAFLIYLYTGGAFNTNEVFGPPKELPLPRYEEVEVNVLYASEGQAYYLGKAIGVTACRELAYSHAEKQDFPPGKTWSYTCCTEEGRSMCDRRLQ